MSENNYEFEMPLAARMRPKSVDDVIGQEHLVGKGKMIRRMLEARRLSSMLLTGPPGVGKTSLARAIAGTAGMKFFEVNAVTSGKKDLEQIIEKKTEEKEQVLLICDEIHRWSRTIMEYLLPFMEEKKVILIGCTTESVVHSIVPAIRSRSKVFELKQLLLEDVKTGLENALKNKEDGLGNMNITISDQILEYFAQVSGGDMRSALNSLEMAAITTEPDENGQIVITEEVAKDVLQHSNLTSFEINDIKSALQKSVRGSDLDAAFFYAAELIVAGELETLCRRLTICCYEDIGLQNVELCQRVAVATEYCLKVGLPEARILLSVIIAEMCLSPKSNTAYKGLDKAIADVKAGLGGEIPNYLRDAHYKGAEKLGRGVGYIYPHDVEGFVNQQYLPNDLIDRRYYVPKMKGAEKAYGERYNAISEIKKKH